MAVGARLDKCIQHLSGHIYAGEATTPSLHRRGQPGMGLPR